MKKAGLFLLPLFAASLLGSALVISNKENKEVEVAEAATDYTSSSHISSYYSKVNGTGSDLLSSVSSTISSPYTTIGYSSLINYYATTDPRSDGKLYDIYSDDTNYTISSAGDSASDLGQGWNKEHTIPQSWWNKSTSQQGCDLYIVRLSDIYCNSTRGNLLYAEVTSSTNNKIGDNKVGNCSNYNEINVTSSTTVFEPRDSIKGDMARTYFYAMARYLTSGANNTAPNWTNGNGAKVFSPSTGSSANNGFVQKYLDMLLRWHKNDPVDAREIARNAAVESCQKNRNPFVDHPSWVDLIWGGTYAGKNAESVAGKTIVNGQPSLSTNPSATITPASPSVTVGGTVQLTASLTNVTNANLISWTSNSTSVATVVKGTTSTTSTVATVTGVSVSSTTISCKYDGTTIGSVTVTVTSSGGGGGGGSSGTYTLEFKTVASDGSTDYASDLSSIIKSDTLTSAISGCSKVYAGTSGAKIGSGSANGTIAFTPVSDARSNVTSITVNCARYGTDTGTLSFTYGSTTSSSFNPTVGSYTLDLSSNPASVSSFSISTSSKRAYISSISFTVGSGSTPEPEPVLSSISVNHAPDKVDYTLGEMFDPTGLVINRVFTDSSLNDTYTYANHESDFEFDPDLDEPLVAGGNVTITYDGQTTTQAITVTAPETFVVVEEEIEAFVKITETADVTSGDYLIVSENSSVAFNGGLETLDAVGNKTTVNPDDGVIASTNALKAQVFTYNSTNNSLRASNGKYIGRSSDSNGLEVSNSVIGNTITIDANENAVIVSGGAYLRYNNASDQTRFRYFRSSTYASQQTIQLYKLESSGGEQNITIGSDLRNAISNYITWDDDADRYLMNQCDYEYGSSFNASTWNAMSSAFSTLKTTYKLARAVANAEGNIVEQFLSVYDYVIGYKKPLGGAWASANDFLGRYEAGGIHENDAYSQIRPSTLSNNNSTVAVVIISLISVSAVGGYFLLRRKKQK